MPEGVILGGWGYVISAYAVVGVVLALYAWSLRTRLVAARRDLDRDAAPGGPRSNGAL